MEHERCYIYTPPEQETTLEEADSATQGKIVNFVTANAPSEDEPRISIPTGLIVAGPSIASHGPYFERLGRRIRDDTGSSYVVLTSGESPNLKTFLKNLIKKITSRTEEDDDDDDDGIGRVTSSSRRGPKLLDFDLGHVLEWSSRNRVQSIVVAIQDSDAFDTGLLVEMVDLFYSWLDRLPFVLLLGIATSAESFEDRLSGKSLRYLDGQQFDVTQSDEIIEKLFRATVAHPGTEPQIGPAICRRIHERQKDHVQNVQDFVHGLKYAYMSHFYANPATIFLKPEPTFTDFSPEAFEAVRNLPYIEEKLEVGETQDVRKLLDSDKLLFEVIKELLVTVKGSLSSLSIAAIVLTRIRESLGNTPRVRLSTVWARAASGDLLESPLLRETMLSIKKAPSDRLMRVIDSLIDFTKQDANIDSEDIDLPVELERLHDELKTLIEENASSGPLRSQDDVRNESVRTTVVAQKVLLSKHKAALSEQDKAYSEVVAKLYQQLDSYFRFALVDPRTFFLYEILVYDLKSPHTEVFQPKPRLAIERALTTPHDYLGCQCCGAMQDSENTLASTQPETAILYQLYLESGALINASDLWSAFNAIVGKEDEEDQSQTMALFQRALAELKFLGHVKPSRKKADHVAKMMWKGL
ncbi:Origin recognition complex subunit 3 [Didymosphaeria variabile]|uniref:Origin recognition complex subunit 3 n=1 Tax=Didymosphaeria variabile TaxID=1932322 RepID=A0A9W8XAL7_9PLEO|nr:Origin recognition complex subunit 3 [Didymosphaeria variabile]KAJ4345534.1 Origin recognition complex subunit 3 [Didymosphaeria variabile]